MSLKLISTLIIGLVLLGTLGAAGFWYLTQQPLYRPGMVSAGKNLRAPLDPPAQPAGDSRWQVEADIALHHFSQGQGRNVLVVHGGPGAPYRHTWSGLEPLAGQYTFHYYDQRGCGDSTRPFDTFTSKNTWDNMQTLEGTLGMGAQLADIERIRRILGEDKLILIGHSWGGFLAALYAAEFPEQVEALILVSPATVLQLPSDQPDLFASVRERLPVGQQAGFDAFMADYMNFGNMFARSEADWVAMNEQFGQFYSQVTDLSDLPAQGRAGGWMVQAQYLSMGRRHDYRPALERVTAPALVLHGADDLQPEAASRMYADLLPGARFAVLDGATHFAFEEQPAAFAGLLGEFLQEVNDKP